jgi:transcriptional regulator with XRE-family HTH domain
MILEPDEKVTKRHIGRNIQKIRVYLGFKQEVLATELGMSQPAISKIEQQEEVEDELLARIARILGVSAETIKDFDSEKAVYNISNHNYKDATISEGATANAIAQQINPVDKIVELYERLLKSEREKNEILSKDKR